jgi:transcriptional regulator with XRE-family HTH domain
MSMKSAQTAKIGKRFKIARELLGFSEAEVSGITFINIDYIKAIESGDYAIFPARMFALRYFEKYSSFLKIKQVFFDIYDSDNIPDDSDVIKKDWIKDFYPEIKIAVTLAVFIIFAFIFNNQWGQTNARKEINKLPSENTQENIAILLQNDPKLIDDALSLINPFIQPSTSQAEESEFREFAVSQGVINNLSLSFVEESWVEIYQGSNQIIYKLFKASDNLEISITPPFKIIVGNAGGIVGFYNQNEINFTQVANKLNVSSIEIDNE